MTAPAKLVSLRFLVLAFIGVALVAFAIVLFAIFHAKMPKMLLQAENEYLSKQIEIVDGILNEAALRTYRQAEGAAVGKNVVAFMRGQNSDFIEHNWPDGSPLQTLRQNFIIFKDLNLNDAYIEFHDYIADSPLEIPPGLSQQLNRIAGAALLKYSGSAGFGGPSGPGGPGAAPVRGALVHSDFGAGGIFFYLDRPYGLAAVPIVETRSAGEPVGVLLLGSALDNEYFKNLTHYRSATFELLNYDDPAARGEPAIHLLGDDIVYTEIQLRDIYDTPITLRLSDSRRIYSAGTQTLWQTNALLVALLGVFALTVYFALAALVLRPIEKLSADIGGIRAGDELNPGKYSKNKEFFALCSAINGMLERIEQSQVSLDVFHSILDGMDIYIYVTDPDTGAILFLNNKVRKDYALGPDALGRPCWEMIQGKSERCGFCRVPRLLEEPERIFQWENRNRRSGFYYHNVDRFIDWPGRGRVHLQQSSDITRLRESEAAIKRRLEQQELMAAMSQRFISNSDTAALINDALNMAGEFMNVSKISVNQYDRERGALLTQYEWFNAGQLGFLSHCPDIPFGPGEAEYEALVVRREPFFRCSDIKRAGFIRSDNLVSFIDVPIFVDGAFWGMLEFGESNAERVWTESDITLVTLIGSVISAGVARGEMEESLLRMSAIVNNSPQAIMYINLNGKFEYFNQGLLDLLGYDAQDLRDGGLARIVDEKTYRVLRGEIIPHVIYGQETSFELSVLKKGGEKRLISLSVFKAGTSSMGIGVIAHDITEQRAMEKELIAARDQAQRSSAAKGEFLSRMSHEMRTPMNAIIGMTNIARGSREAEKKEYCLEKISDASQHLLGVINDILDMSKIEANKFELSFTEFDFEKMLQRVLGVINFRLEEKRQHLVVKVDPLMPRLVISDEQRLAQVIANLLSNAVKFTPDEGTVSLAVKVLENSEDACDIKLSVSDTGIGISPDQQRRLFRSFEQADGGISRRFGGTGLGLVISKSIVEMLGGRIWVESDLNRGSTFSFTIPVKKGASARQSLPGSGADWEGLRLLAVDDAPDALEFFSQFAANAGLGCALAANGEEALALLEDGSEFDLVFIGWKLPDMDGLDLAERLRERGGASGRVALMLPGADWPDIESLARQAGVSRFVPKPLFASTLVDCINGFLGVGRGDFTPARPAAINDMKGIFAKRRVLLVEDIAINSEIVITLLEDTGIEADCAMNGREALDMFICNPGRYDIILMDIHMPEVDGYEGTRRIRALGTPEARNIPIVAMTANVFREDIEKCLAAGMNDHIGKPVDLSEILAKLCRWMPER